MMKRCRRSRGVLKWSCPRRFGGRPWISSPATGEKKVEISPDGTCNLYGWHLNYTIVHISDDEVVLDADGSEIHITLNPLGLSELHVSGDWDDHYVNRPEYWDIIYKSWAGLNGERIEILPAGVSMSTAGFYPEFSYDAENGLIDVLEDGQVLYTISTGDSQLFVMDMDGNEVLYNADVDYMDPGNIEDPTEDPVDEEMRLWLAYDKVVNDFNASIADQPVCDDEGKEITSGPVLAEYLYNQLLALGDFEDAYTYLPFFKTRTEIVTTEQWYSHVNGYEREYVHDLPDYDVFGQPDDEAYIASTFGIRHNISGNRDVDLVYDENDVVTQVIITMTDGVGGVKGTCVADVEYNERGQRIATHVAFVDEAGNDVRYTSTFEYDSAGNLIRVDIPYVVDAEHYGHTITYLYRYDEYGRRVLESWITTVVDESWYAYGTEPGSKRVTENFYNEHGLLIRELTHSIDNLNPGSGHYEYIYTYDEEDRLIKEESFRIEVNFNDYYQEHGDEKTDELLDEYRSDFFHPGVSSDEATLEDWFVTEQPVDISKWDFVITRIPLDVSTYTYDKTVTIMCIDLTPED